MTVCARWVMLWALGFGGPCSFTRDGALGVWLGLFGMQSFLDCCVPYACTWWFVGFRTAFIYRSNGGWFNRCVGRFPVLVTDICMYVDRTARDVEGAETHFADFRLECASLSGALSQALDANVRLRKTMQESRCVRTGGLRRVHRTEPYFGRFVSSEVPLLAVEQVG